MKQLRNRADEDARLVHMSLQMDSELPSSLRKDLDHLMILVSFMLIFTITPTRPFSLFFNLMSVGFCFVFVDRRVLQ